MHTPTGLRSFLLLVCCALLASASAAPAAPLTAAGTLPAPDPSLVDWPERARGEAVVEDEAPQLRATLLVEPAPDAPASVGVLFELAAGWHLYWRNPGETGVAPEITFDAPGRTFGPLAWPAPQTFREADDLFTTYGYEGRVLLAAPFEPAAAPVGAAPIDPAPIVRAEVSVLVCRTQCVPAAFSLALPLDSARSLDVADRAGLTAIFADARARVPRSAAAIGWRVDAHWPAGAPAVDETRTLVLSVDPCGEAKGEAKGDCALAMGEGGSEFLPFASDVLELARDPGPAADADDGRIALAFDATRLEPGDARLRGVVVLRDERGAPGAVHAAEIDVAIGGAIGGAPATAGSTIASATGSTTPLAWLRIVLLALLGGLVLNGMPCVLPVLALKVVSIADLAARDARDVRLHGLAYTAGVLGSMLVLAGVVLGLRGAGHAVGWGFQFQEPLFVAAIAALLVTFALNLFGVFEIELGQGRLAALGQDRAGVSRSAFEGLLAVVLATPCTAPFLGTAVGFAFASSGYGIVAIFLAIGAGLASPFLLVSFFPRLARFIPRSGPWMLKLRAGLGFCLLATVVWLLWIVGQSGGPDAIAALTAALLFLAFLLWTFGQLQPMRSPWLGRASAVGIAALAFASFNLIDFEPAAPRGDPDAPSEEATTDEAVYSAEAVRTSLAAGVPAFVVFTADWCLTCKVNERTVLDRPAVREALAAGGYALFKADWTRRDDAIRATLAAFGRAGVPLYLVYDPAAPDEPRVLSELLTQDEVLAALALPADVARR